MQPKSDIRPHRAMPFLFLMCLACADVEPVVENCIPMYDAQRELGVHACSLARRCSLLSAMDKCDAALFFEPASGSISRMHLIECLTAIDRVQCPLPMESLTLPSACDYNAPAYQNCY